jgi:DNA-binding MarR family transcriptional regulator
MTTHARRTDMRRLWALARTSDPATSHAAAADVSLRVNNIELQVLAALVLRGPSTSHDLADYTGLSLVTVSPRMAPLESRGLVKRFCVINRRTIWDVTPRAMLAIQ